MKRKYLVIVNPVAGKGKGEKAYHEIKEFLSDKSLDYEIVLTERPEHAKEITRMKSAEFNVIVAVGGDGTNNEIINGLDFEKEKIFAVVPIGSGNDLVHNYPYPKDIDEIFKTIFAEEINVMNIDVGKIIYKEQNSSESKTHYFINGLGIGFDAFVAYLNQQNKTLSGIASYILAVGKALKTYKPFEIDFATETIKEKGEKMLLAIGNGVSAGGGFYLTPNGIVNDGLLELCVLDTVGKAELMAKLPLALINKVDKIRQISLSRFKRLKINEISPTFVHADGETVATKLISAEISLAQNNKLKIITG
ncbi:MAG: YegS/Rv2252/BmrU family lipid kinase [Chlorobi bacterium]|nr:YegS/Rv2252/BmrU family lipid kinase [Chlorobiota bacterium]